MPATPMPAEPVPAEHSRPFDLGAEPPAPELESRFASGRRHGRVRFSVRRLDDPTGAGWSSVFGVPSPEVVRDLWSSAAGFPTMFARAEPEGSGYENWLGWIQMVNERTPRGREIRADHDSVWFLQGRDVPYGAVGYAPTFYDAPTRPERAAVLWEADLFLCTVPSLRDGADARTSSIEPLAGVRWGFRIERDGEAPLSLPLRPAGNWAWASWVPILRRTFPRWRFAERTPSMPFERRFTGPD